jgi:uncharacterized protein
MIMAGTLLQVRVTPKAAVDRIVVDDGNYRIYVTAVPEDGKATKAVISLLAKHLGIAKSRLELVRGETARDKVFRVL